MASLNDYKKHIQVLKMEQKIGRIQKELETVDYGDECPLHGENDCADVRKVYDRGYVGGLYEAMTLFKLIEADTPQTDAEITELAKEIVHKMIDDGDIAEDADPDLRERMHEAVERLDEYYPSEDERSE